MRRIFRQQSGFTLVELVIALFITSMIGMGGVMLLRGAGESASDAASDSKQISELRTAMDQITRDLRDADKPLVYASNAGSPVGSSAQATEMIFFRSSRREDVSQASGFRETAVMERIFLQGRKILKQVKPIAPNPGAGTNSLAEERERISETPSEYMTVSGVDPWAGVRTRVIMNEAEFPAGGETLFRLYRQANAPTSSLQRVSLVDVYLRRDDDGAGSESGRGAGSIEAATLRTSVYLRKVGTRSTGGGSPVGC